jgi:replication fork protection complex subunit Csm3/Swi3
MSSPGETQPLPTEGPTAGGDELDDLFDYDGGANDPFNDNYKVPARNETARENGRSGAGLGIDEQVEVTAKPRAPRVKLDEDR